jgi:primosomal protein DnaI
MSELKPLGNMVDKLPEYRKQVAREQTKQVLADEDVRPFFSENNIEKEMVIKYLSQFKEYFKYRESGLNGKYPKLEFKHNQISVGYEFSQEDEQRIKDGVRKGIVRDYVTSKTKGVSFDDIEVDPTNAFLKKQLIDLVENYRYGDSQNGLWIHGKVGIGKTYMISAMANALASKGAGVVFVNWLNTITQITDSYSYRKHESHEKEYQINKLSKAEILIIDDIGTEKSSQHNLKDVLYQILENRTNALKPTFFTSNYSIAEYEEINANNVGRMDAERLTERIEMLAKEVRLTGENKRKKA